LGTDDLQELGRRSALKLKQRQGNPLKRLFRHADVSLHTGACLKQLLGALDPSARILDIGSGSLCLREGIITLDIGAFPNVTVIGDAARLPFGSGCFDAAVSVAVLEHVCNPPAIVAEIRRVLRTGGYVYAEVPFLEGFHAAPHDYQRYTLPGIEYLFRDFLRQDSGVCVGPSSALAWLLREYLALFAGTGKVRAYAAHLFGYLTFWIKYMDVLLARHPEAHVIASGLFYFGRKGGAA